MPQDSKNLLEGLDQKSMSHPQQEPHFKQNWSNFAILIRSTYSTRQHCPAPSSITDPCLLPCPASKSQRGRQHTQTATCKQKQSPTKKSTSAGELPEPLPEISG